MQSKCRRLAGLSAPWQNVTLWRCQCLSGIRRKQSWQRDLIYSPRFVQGLIARITHDDAKARAAFTAARAEQEKLVRADPDDAGALCVLGLIDAALGRKEEALREGRRAVELLPVEKDSTNGTRMIGVSG